ncbi:MAG TPA: efflux RND transporter periplasmic adaptor subunit [Pirellulales bacterium]|nr:efflux RND transporter periplasmic adaptor subunit [Pirellulales bacterium]
MSLFTSTRRKIIPKPHTSVPAGPINPSAKVRLNRNWLRGSFSTLFVIGMLGAIAAWGHATDWTLPKFSALFFGGKNAPNACIVDGEGWCQEHNVPEAICIECDQKLVPPLPDYGWCAEHGISECPLHHPDIAQLKETPHISDQDFQRAHRALALLPRAENSSRCKNYQKRIQFASVEAMDKTGLDIAVVDQAPIIEALCANGEIIYDQTHLAHLASRVTGTVWRVENQVGQPVRQGDVLALIDSADVGKAKADLLQAITGVRLRQENVTRLQPLAAEGAVPGKQLREAEAALQEAQIRLLSAEQTLTNLGMPVETDQFDRLSTQQIAKQIQFLGLPATITAGLEKDATSNLFPLRSPLDGVVVDCKVVPGESVDTTATIFGVADLTRMWLMLDVRQEDAGRISFGQPVLFQASDAKSQPVAGNVAWISTEADDKTRTVKVRVDLPNPDHKLRSNTFGSGRVVLRDEPSAMVVPTEAVHTDGDCSIVFVRDKNFLQDGSLKFFHVREVRVGVQDGGTSEIIAGLLPGEVVACKNSMVLEAQLLKSNLGAGCACCAAAKK